MRQPHIANKRSRGRGGGRRPQNPHNQTFDSNGPGVRIRGNAIQVFEKYQQLARDASSAGDRVAAENLFQHAEHYYRLHQAAQANVAGNGQDRRPQQHGQPQQQQPAAGANPGGDAAPQAEPQTESRTQPQVEGQAEPRVETPAEAPAEQAPASAEAAAESEAPRGRGAGNGRRRPRRSAEENAAPGAKAESSDQSSDDAEPESEPAPA